jgi:hypothetical protein
MVAGKASNEEAKIDASSIHPDSLEFQADAMEHKSSSHNVDVLIFLNIGIIEFRSRSPPFRLATPATGGARSLDDRNFVIRAPSHSIHLDQV